MSKQGTRPLRGETFNQAKSHYKELAETSKQLINVLKDEQQIKAERAIIRYTYQELKQLYKWRENARQLLLAKKVSTRDRR